LLSEEGGIDVVAEAGTAAEAVSLAGDLRPDVLVLDLGLPDDPGVWAIRRIIEANSGTRVLVLTMHDEIEYLREAFAAGASGYVVKEAADVELIQAIRTVAAGRRYVHPTLGAALLDDADHVATRGPISELSAREVEVLRLVALGHTQTEIAERLHLSVRTIETHRAHIQQKLGVRSRAELARLAREAGLLDGA
jgi:DNA-binding NarL/FixJ family response regulator